MPQRIEMPRCLREFLSRMYPDVDLGSVRFHKGVPWYTFSGGAITIGHDVYFREHRADFCSRDGVALAAHELYHIRDGAGGPGVWFVRPFYARYLVGLVACGFRTDSRHAMEKPAYALQERVKERFDEAKQVSGEDGPCACADGEPSGVNQAFTDAFFADWAGIDA